ncbi:MAG: hypothetical protein AB7I38_11140 [Dehalococcoidia bacterium]
MSLIDDIRGATVIFTRDQVPEELAAAAGELVEAKYLNSSFGPSVVLVQLESGASYLIPPDVHCALLHGARAAVA